MPQCAKGASRGRAGGRAGNSARAATVRRGVTRFRPLLPKEASAPTPRKEIPEEVDELTEINPSIEPTADKNATHSEPPPETKISDHQDAEDTEETGSINHYIFACISCQRIMRIFSTAILSPDTLYADDKFFPVFCESCQKRERPSEPSKQPIKKGAGAKKKQASHLQKLDTPAQSVILRISPRVLHRWELHVFSKATFDIGLSNSSAHRPVWNATQAWETLRLGESKLSGPPALDAESVNIDWVDLHSHSSQVKRWQLLPSIQQGFFSPEITAQVNQAVGASARAGKWRNMATEEGSS